SHSRKPAFLAAVCEQYPLHFVTPRLKLRLRPICALRRKSAFAKPFPANRPEGRTPTVPQIQFLTEHRPRTFRWLRPTDRPRGLRDRTEPWKVAPDPQAPR